MIVYLILAILKERYRLKNSLAQLLHFLEADFFERKSFISIFQFNSRENPNGAVRKDIQLKLFDY